MTRFSDFFNNRVFDHGLISHKFIRGTNNRAIITDTLNRLHNYYLNRFISADTIVPNPANPQRLNRYTYTKNNPLKYTDPTGHDQCGELLPCNEKDIEPGPNLPEGHGGYNVPGGMTKGGGITGSTGGGSPIYTDDDQATVDEYAQKFYTKFQEEKGVGYNQGLKTTEEIVNANWNLGECGRNCKVMTDSIPNSTALRMEADLKTWDIKIEGPAGTINVGGPSHYVALTKGLDGTLKVLDPATKTWRQNLGSYLQRIETEIKNFYFNTQTQW